MNIFFGFVSLACIGIFIMAVRERTKAGIPIAALLLAFGAIGYGISFNTQNKTVAEVKTETVEVKPTPLFDCVSNDGLFTFVIAIDKANKQIRMNHVTFDTDFDIGETNVTASRTYESRIDVDTDETQAYKQDIKFNKFTGAVYTYINGKDSIMMDCKEAVSLID